MVLDELLALLLLHVETLKLRETDGLDELAELYRDLQGQNGDVIDWDAVTVDHIPGVDIPLGHLHFYCFVRTFLVTPALIGAVILSTISIKAVIFSTILSSFIKMVVD